MRSGRDSGGRPQAGGPATTPGTTDEIAAVTLVTGSEPFLVSRAVAQAVNRLRAQTPEADVHHLDAADSSALAALPEALSPSLFSPTAIGVITNLQEASDGLVDLLVGLMGDLGDNRAVVTHSGTKGRKHLDRIAGLKVTGGVSVVSVPAVKKGRGTRDFLIEQARIAGRRLPTASADALVRAVGSDLPLLIAALEQLLADFPEDPVSPDVVITQFAGVAEVTGFNYADAIWAREPGRALVQLRLGEAANSLSAPAATGAAATGLRSMVRVASAPPGLPDAEVARIASVPPFKVRDLAAAKRAWSDRELAAAVVGLAQLDVAVKAGLLPGDNLEPAQKAYLLSRWSTQSCAPVARTDS